MIVVKHVSKLFGETRAVDDISFNVKEGQNFVFLGTSGCGKTTTLRMINRLTEPSSGNILVNGKNVGEQHPDMLRRSIGYVLQHNGLFPHYTVAENIEVVPHLLKMEKAHTRRRTIELMEKLHLSPAKYLDAYPEQLSGGQQQRVGLARALAADPPVLLMDEPFGALDTITRTTIRKEFSELDEFKRKTIVMVTHDVQEAFALADTVCLMDKGQIVQVGSPAELIFHPANEFVTGFLSAEKSQLAFRSVRLLQLWEFLPEHKINEKHQASSITTDATVWEAMEIFYEQNSIESASITVSHSTTKETKHLFFVDLMTSMNRLKK
ncbi:MAG: ATP-binding cassette domain-containing protein [Chitinophagaceae bacterium]